MPFDHTDDQLALVRVMAWQHQATSHYLNQFWPISMLLWQKAISWTNVDSYRCHHMVLLDHSEWKIKVIIYRLLLIFIKALWTQTPHFLYSMFSTLFIFVYYHGVYWETAGITDWHKLTYCWLMHWRQIGIRIEWDGWLNKTLETIIEPTNPQDIAKYWT